MEITEIEKTANLRKIGSMFLRRGQRLFEVNKITLEVREARYEKSTDGKSPSRLIVNPDCWYCPAINQKNAIRKFTQLAVRLFAGQ